MLLFILYYLPSMVSLFWVVFFLMKKKDMRQQVFCIAEFLSVAFYLLYATYTLPLTDYPEMIRLEAVGIPLSLIFSAFAVNYVHILYNGRKLRNIWFTVLILPALIEFGAILTLLYLIGFDNAAEISRQFASQEGLTGMQGTKLSRLYCFVTYDAFIFIASVSMIALVSLCAAVIIRNGYRPGDVLRFLLKGKAGVRDCALALLLILECLLLVPSIAVGSVFLSEHALLGGGIAIALAAIKYITAYLEFYGEDRRDVTLHSLSHLPVAQQSDVSAPESVTPPAEIRNDARHEQFRNLMENEQIWKDDNLTADVICKTMGIGKTTLSQLVNQNYGTTLREVICQYRIEEAKRFMKAHPDAKQESIAEHCGFKNAQYFNTLFKKMVGKTPAMWLINQD